MFKKVFVKDKQDKPSDPENDKTSAEKKGLFGRKKNKNTTVPIKTQQDNTTIPKLTQQVNTTVPKPTQQANQDFKIDFQPDSYFIEQIPSSQHEAQDDMNHKKRSFQVQRRTNVLTQEQEQSISTRQKFYTKNISEFQEDDDDEPDIFKALDQQARQTNGQSRPSIQEEVKNEILLQIAPGNSLIVESAVKMPEVVDQSEHPETTNKKIIYPQPLLDADEDRDYFDNEVKVREPSKSTVKVNRREQAIQSSPFFQEISREVNQVAIDEILTLRRNKTSESTSARRQAVIGPTFQDELLDLFEKEDSKQNSSEDFLSDESSECDSLSLGDFEGSKKLQDVFQRRQQVEGEFKIHNFLEEMVEKHNTDPPENEVKAAMNDDVEKTMDTIKLVDLYEKKQVEFAESTRQELKQLAIQGSIKKKAVLKSVFSKARKMNYQRAVGIIETCVALTDHLVLVGTQNGTLYCFDKETDELVTIYNESGKDYKNNAITCIDVHPKRQEFVVLGFQGGQVTLVNIESKKNIKQIEKIHKGNPIVTVKFCDWVREHPKWEAAIKSGEDINLQVYDNAFMFTSIAADGRVVVNDVEKVSYLLYADDTTLIDIKNWGKPKCEVLASKFYSLEHPQGRDNDLHSTLIAVASLNELLIYQIVKEGKAIKEQLLTWSRPEFYPSESALGNCAMPDKLPLISWGYGKTPIFKDKAYIILAVAWGPLIQLIVVDQNKKTNIIFDGYYFIPQTASSDQDAYILSLQFLDESVLLVTTSNQEVRVLNTQKFHYSKYEGKAAESDFSKLSSLQYVASRGKQLTDEQKAVELQLATLMDGTPQQSLFGSTQAIGVWNQHIVYLTQTDVFVLKHLSGDDFLASVDQQFESEGESFYYSLDKVFEVYRGSIRGLRGLNGDSQKEAIKSDLKQRILLEVSRFEKIKQEEYPLMVRRCIDFCLENNETNFLFEVMFPVFHAQQKGQIFVEEILSPILIGKFKDCCIPEEILSNHIMHYHQQRDSGVFERMLMNLRFDHLSEGYKSFILDTCQQLRFSSSLIYVCLSAYGESGALISLRRLQDLYKQPDNFFSLQQLQKLLSMTVDLGEKATLEKSSTYIGLKLMWLVRCYLLGNKFPKGFLKHNEFRSICCDVANLLTQNYFMDTMFQIDYSAFFQVLTIIFNVGSKTYTFISEQQKSISHDAIVSRVTDYCFSLPPENPIRLHFLCFIASICDSYINKSQSQEFFFTVAVELMHHNIEMLSFNKSRIEIQMENNQFYRKLSKVGIKGPDNLKHVQLSEENLLKVVKTVESLGPLPKKMIDQLILAAEETTFERLQLFLYDINHDYVKCLKLLIASVNLQTESSKVEKGFNWITEKHKCLKSRVYDQNEESKDNYQLKCFEREVLNQAETLVTLDPGKAVLMCEVMFEQKHLELINRLAKEYLQHWYIKELIRLKEAEIRDQLVGYSQAVNTSEAQQYKQILNLQVTLMCKLEPANVVSEAKKIKKLGFYPIESLLVTYRKFNQLEACAILGNKMGLYLNSVEIYLELLVGNLKIKELRKELFKVSELVKKIENKQQLKRWELEEASGFTQPKLPLWERGKSLPTFMDEFSLLFQKAQWIKRYAPNIQLFDRMMTSIQKLCRKHPVPVLKDKNVIWRKVLETVLKISNEAIVKKKRFCKIYFRDKAVSFSKVIMDYVKLDQIIAAMVQHKPNAKFKAIESLVHQIFIMKQGEIAMCSYARQIIVKDLAKQAEQNLNRFQEGVLSTNVSDGIPCCDLCKGLFKNQTALFSNSTQSMRVFDCSRNQLAQKNHSFHLRCLNKFLTEESMLLSKQSSQKLDSAQLRSKMRCPVCQVVSFDILPQPKYKPASRKNKLRQANPSSAEEDDQASQGQIRKTNKVTRKEKEMQKRLVAFDASLGDEYLQSDDFFKSI